MKTCVVCSVAYPDAVEYCPRDGQLLPMVAGRGPLDPLVGQTIDGRYLVEALLGEGGMGFVYAGRHAIIDKRVAIKVLRKEAAKDDLAAQRFIIEAKAAGKIGHQNIVDITDFGVLPTGNPYFVMEYIEGPTLGRLVHEKRHLPPLQAVRIAIQVARGLYAAHQKSIIHRDLKPENVFVIAKNGEHDVVKVVDFGIAKDVKAGKRLTAIGMVLGTPEYMSPEQATGQETDHRVDQYALGCILYEMLTGEVPFKGENAPKTLTKHVFDALVPPSQLKPELFVPQAIEEVVVRMLQKKPADRYRDMHGVVTALEQVADELEAGLTVKRAMPLPRHTDERVLLTEVIDIPRERPSSRRYIALAIGGAVGLAIAVFALTRSTRAIQAARDPEAAAVVQPAVASPPAPAAPGPTAVPEENNQADVEIQVVTVPPGAQVFLDGESLGMSPIDVRRPRRAAPAMFTIRHLGMRPVSRTVSLDRDQTLEIVLSEKHERLSARAATNKAAPKAQPDENVPAATKHKASDLRNPFE